MRTDYEKDHQLNDPGFTGEGEETFSCVGIAEQLASLYLDIQILFDKFDMLQFIISRYRTCYFDILIYCNVIAIESIFITSYRYSVVLLCSIIDYIYYNIHQISLTYQSLKVCTHQFYFFTLHPLLIDSLLSVHFIGFTFLDSAYKGYHTVLVLPVGLKSLSIMCSWSIHDVTNDRISFLLVAE